MRQLAAHQSRQRRASSRTRLAAVPGVEVLDARVLQRVRHPRCRARPLRLIDRGCWPTGHRSPACRSRGSTRQAGLATTCIVVAATETTTDERHRARFAAAPEGGRCDAMNSQGRPTRPRTRRRLATRTTFTGDRGLLQEEPLLFELGGSDRTGVDLPEPKPSRLDLGGLERKAPIGLPGLSEPEAMRHYVRLSPQELRHRPGALSAGLVHDEAQPAAQREDGAPAGLRRPASAAAAVTTVQGALELMDALAHWLQDADRHARRCHVAQGRRAWRALRHAGHQGRARGRRRGRAAARVLVPDSAHGTNPATAAFVGYLGARLSRRARTARSICAGR